MVMLSLALSWPLRSMQSVCGTDFEFVTTLLTLQSW